LFQPVKTVAERAHRAFHAIQDAVDDPGGVFNNLSQSISAPSGLYNMAVAARIAANVSVTSKLLKGFGCSRAVPRPARQYTFQAPRWCGV
jgi:hypothetical protein